MTTSPRRRGPRGDVSAVALLAAADRVLRAGGPGALSLRSVAREAGVAPNAVYTYFTDMSDLRNQMGDQFLGLLDLALLTSGGPRESLLRFLRHVVGAIRDSPEHAALLAAQRIAGPHALALNEALLDFCIDRVGHSPAGASAATQLLTEWVHGHVQLASTEPAPPSFLEALVSVDLDAYPRTKQMLTRSTDDLTLELLAAAVTAGPTTIA